LNQKLSLNSQVDSPSDDALTPSDDAVRQALLRMGAGSGQNGNQHGGQHFQGRRGGEQVSAASASPDARRRRFSQNEHVPVEYVSRDRQAGRHDTSRHEPGRHEQSRHEQGRHDQGRLDQGRHESAEAGDDRTAMLEREFDRERQARLAAERGLAETKLALQNAQTRLAHLEIDLTEARAQRQALLALAPHPANQAASAPDAAEDGGAAPPMATGGSGAGFGTPPRPVAQPVKRGRGRPRLSAPRATVPETETEPEPVKWWVGD
jgi:hypothetical protein